MGITKKRRVLVSCEYSGRVRDEFTKLGWIAVSCDLLPSESPGGIHYQGDVRGILHLDWDLMVAFPDCTYMCSSGMHWTVRGLRDPQLTTDAIAFAETLWDAPIPHIAIENPVGCLSTRSKLGKPSCVLQPFEFGEDASKKTCLWLKDLPIPKPTQIIQPRIVDGKKRYGNQCDSGQNRLGPSEDRWKERARTYAGIAKAMAETWNDYIK
jgi:hypothetical protein